MLLAAEEILMKKGKKETKLEKISAKREQNEEFWPDFKTDFEEWYKTNDFGITAADVKTIFTEKKRVLPTKGGAARQTILISPPASPY